MSDKTNKTVIFLQENYPLDSLNSFGFKVTARHYARFADVSALQDIIDECADNGLPYHILGGGSNTIFTGNFNGAVLQASSCKVNLAEPTLVVADAGVEWDYFVAWCVEHDLQGLENLSHIPGTVGASPVQNIGAYGIEAADRVEWVEYFDPSTRQLKTIHAKDCQFAYRHSIFKTELSDAVVLRVAYRLCPADRADYRIDYGDLGRELQAMSGVSALNIRNAVIKIRSEKLPDPRHLGNAGSFFKNPVVSFAQFAELQKTYPDIAFYALDSGVKIPAGWLIDRAGFKGYRQSRVGVHEKQALVLVNYGGATAEEILNLASVIENAVYEKYGIAIQKEVTIV